MRYIELLSPAKNAEIGKEAILHGADAVYIGGPAFGARQAATNSIEEIADLCKFAHQYLAKVYVTLNTLLEDREMFEAENLIWHLYEIGVDALIIQDVRILSMNLPPISLHASTQMDNRSVDKFLELAKTGFTQAVVARELNIEDIANIHLAVPQIKLESFVHGALCVGMSGICFASEYMYGRSANRGECAQICRMRFNLEDNNGKKLINNRYLLSLRDMNRSKKIKDMVMAGISSFKIEGRLKDMAYVKNTTAAYRAEIDKIISCYPDLYRRSSIGKTTTTFIPDLSRVFNRKFTDYLDKRDIFSPFTPKSYGKEIGFVQEISSRGIRIFTDDSTLVAGDGLCFLDKDNTLKGFRVNSIVQGFVIPRPFPKNIVIGTKIYRNLDYSFNEILSSTSATRLIPLKLDFSNTISGFRITALINNEFSLDIDFDFKHEFARTDQSVNIKKQLSRLGNTIFEAVEVNVNTTKNLFVPSSILTIWKKELIKKIFSKLEQVRISNKTEESYDSNNSLHNTRYESDKPLMICKHCIRRELGACLKGKTPKHFTISKFDIPVDKCLFLTTDDGHRLAIKFDCKNCEMQIYKT